MLYIDVKHEGEKKERKKGYCMIHLPLPHYLQDEVDAKVSNNLDDDTGAEELVFFVENIEIKLVAF